MLQWDTVYCLHVHSPSTLTAVLIIAHLRLCCPVVFTQAVQCYMSQWGLFLTKVLCYMDKWAIYIL